MMISTKTTVLFLTLISATFLFSDVVSADVQEEIAGRQKQIEELQKQIEEYQSQIDTSRGQSRTLENEVGQLNAKINQINLEIRSLELTANNTRLEIGETEKEISASENAMTKHKSALAQYVNIAYQNDQTTLTEILFSNESLSDFFNYLNSVQSTQDNLQIAIQGIRKLKTDLEDRQEVLESKKTDLEHLIGIQAVQKQSLDINKREKDHILKETKGQEAKFQELIKQSQRNIEAIREQLTFIRQYGISAEDAVRTAQLAAVGAGVRPAFLLAILEIESRLGQNVGTGNWQDDMVLCYRRLGDIWYPHRRAHFYQRAATEEAAFLKITSQLGIDPNSVKVSREPNYGCGGAMGPAQFIPSTWLAYEKEVARLTGHNPPNPWEMEDAFTASAIKLANGGANKKTRAGESSAARAYIGGSTKCGINDWAHICSSYSRLVLQKADEIEKNL